MAKSESIKDPAHAVRREAGSAIEGDKILVQCRKVRSDKMQKVRGSDAHHYFYNELMMNAYAVIDRTFKNPRK